MVVSDLLFSSRSSRERPWATVLEGGLGGGAKGKNLFHEETEVTNHTYEMNDGFSTCTTNSYHLHDRNFHKNPINEVHEEEEVPGLGAVEAEVVDDADFQDDHLQECRSIFKAHSNCSSHFSPRFHFFRDAF